MKIAVVYDSHTGRTAAAASAMHRVLEGAGHEGPMGSVASIDPARASDAELLVTGCPTWGLFVIFQHPTRQWTEWIERLGDLEGTRVVLFTTYLLAHGRTLDKMARLVEQRGGEVVGRLASRGSGLPAGFDSLVRDL